MKKLKDKGIKNLLNLKEDYILKLDDYKANDTLRFDEDGEEDKVELTQKEAPEESAEDTKEAENKDTETKKDDSAAEDSKEDKDSTEKKEPEKETAAEGSTKYQVNLTNVYEIMRKAKSPADVGLALKSFLKLLQSNSLENLSASN